MAKCWLLLFENCAGVKGHSFISGDGPMGTVPGSCGVILIINGSNTGIGEASASWTDVSNGFYPAMIPPGYETNYGQGCTPPTIPESTSYDCINGACTPSTTYNTPGLYQSLSECEVNCGTEGCSGKCISNSEWSQIEGLANQLKGKNCS